MTARTTGGPDPRKADRELAEQIIEVLLDYPNQGLTSLQIARVIAGGSANRDVLLKIRRRMYRANDITRKIARENDLALQIDRDAGVADAAVYLLTDEDTAQGEREAVRRMRKIGSAAVTVDHELRGTSVTARVMKTSAGAIAAMVEMAREAMVAAEEAARAEAKERRRSQ